MVDAKLLRRELDDLRSSYPQANVSVRDILNAYLEGLSMFEDGDVKRACSLAKRECQFYPTVFELYQRAFAFARERKRTQKLADEHARIAHAYAVRDQTIPVEHARDMIAQIIDMLSQKIDTHHRSPGFMFSGEADLDTTIWKTAQSIYGMGKMSQDGRGLVKEG